MECWPLIAEYGERAGAQRSAYTRSASASVQATEPRSEFAAASDWKVPASARRFTERRQCCVSADATRIRDENLEREQPG